MYQALYRKYRPRCFSDVAGQEHVTQTLRRQIVSNRLSHAYLFVGTRGTGKTTCAKILSRAVNCIAPQDGEPCNKCVSCIGIENGSILDVLELDAASNNGVDNVRALRDEAIYSPASVKRRVYIVDEVHMLSTPAFNALLKILEEPPEHLIFILATTELHKVPATILSRCQRFSFKRISSAAIEERLHIIAKNEDLTLTKDAGERLAALAEGSMRDGLSLLDQCASDSIVDISRVLDMLGLAGQQELLKLIISASDRDVSGALTSLEGLYNDGRDMTSLLGELAALMRDVLVYKLWQDSPLLSGSFSRTELAALSKKLTSERLFSWLGMIRESIFCLSRGGSSKLTIEMCLIRMCDERLLDDSSALAARIAKLESAVDTVPANLGRLISGLPPDATENIGMPTESFGDSEPSSKMSEISIAPPELPVDSGSPPETTEDSEAPPEMPVDLGSPPETTKDSESLTETSDLKTPPEELSSGFWTDILELLKDDIPVHALLSDSAKVQAEQQDSALIIRARDIFTINSIESKMFSEPLREAAKSVLGREVFVRVEIGGVDNSTSKNDRLERLSAFDIVKFE